MDPSSSWPQTFCVSRSWPWILELLTSSHARSWTFEPLRPAVPLHSLVQTLPFTDTNFQLPHTPAHTLGPTHMYYASPSNLTQTCSLFGNPSCSHWTALCKLLKLGVHSSCWYTVSAVDEPSNIFIRDRQFLSGLFVNVFFNVSSSQHNRSLELVVQKTIATKKNKKI